MALSYAMVQPCPAIWDAWGCNIDGLETLGIFGVWMVSGGKLMQTIFYFIPLISFIYPWISMIFHDIQKISKGLKRYPKHHSFLVGHPGSGMRAEERPAGTVWVLKSTKRSKDMMIWCKSWMRQRICWPTLMTSMTCCPGWSRPMSAYTFWRRRIWTWLGFCRCMSRALVCFPVQSNGRCHERGVQEVFTVPGV